MGTRSRTEVFEDGKCIVSIYRQFDGYPSCHGLELAEFLNGIKVINGISGGAKAGTHANGVGCLAAQLVAHLKSPKGKAEIGGIYLHAPMTADGDCGEEFIYRIEGSYDGPVTVKVTGGDVTAFGMPNDPKSFKGIFSGTIAEFLEFCKKEE